MTPIVIGTAHRIDNRLVDAYGAKQFSQEICPLITDDTLLILEGAYHRPIFGPGHKKYPSRRKLAEHILGVTLPASPLLGWRDSRYFPMHRSIAELLILDRVQQGVVSQISQPGLSCGSLSELTQRVHDGIPPHFSKKRIPRPWQIILWGLSASVKEHDRRVIAAAQKHAETHQVIIVVGAMHALEISRSQGWTLKLFIPNTPQSARHLIRIYHTVYVLPQYFQRPIRR